MSIQHKDLAAGRWRELSFIEQMANIGSEVGRSLNWRERNQPTYSEKALVRALELIDLTMDVNRQRGRLRELARVREALIDFVEGTGDFDTSADSWRKYFLAFAYAARKDR